MSNIEQAILPATPIETSEKQAKFRSESAAVLLDVSSNGRWQEMNRSYSSNQDVIAMLNDGFTLIDSSPPPLTPQRAESDKAPKVRDAAAQTKWDHEKKDFAYEHGVQITEKDGKLEYRVKGHKDALFTTDATKKGLDEADKKLHEMIAQKEADLNKKYGVTFSTDGETAGKQIVLADGKWKWGTDEVRCRAPHINELIGIEEALDHSQPTAHGVRFYVTINDLYKENGEAAAFAPVPQNGSDKTAAPGSHAIFLKGYKTENMDADDSANPMDHFYRDSAKFSVQYIVTHELAHFSQQQMGNQRAEKIATEMGWVSPIPFTHNTKDWLLEDKEGHFWKKETLSGNQFIRCDRQGLPINKDGQPVDGQSAQHISSDDLMDKVKPAPYNNYYANPLEEFAETMTCFRMGGSERKAVAQRNPDLYKIIKNADQEEINKVHPIDPATHQPTYIRDADGNIVPNTEAARRPLEKYEPK